MDRSSPAEDVFSQLSRDLTSAVEKLRVELSSC